MNITSIKDGVKCRMKKKAKAKTASRSEDEPSGARIRRMAVIHNIDYQTNRNPNIIDPAPCLEANAEVEAITNGIATILNQNGIEAFIIQVNSRLDGLVSYLRDQKVDAVFNLVESLGNDPSREPELPLMLEAAGIPYTGNGPAVLALANAKDKAKQILAAHHLPVPAGFTIWNPAEIPRLSEARLRFPVFAKPARSDASIGIDQESVIYSRQNLRKRVSWLMESIPQPVLIEEYLPGREINVAIFPDPFYGHIVPTEIDFSPYPEGLAPIVTYNCKWKPDSPEYAACSHPCSDHLPENLLQEVLRIARASFTTLGGTSYGRVDMRLNVKGEPVVIDVNPNNDLDREAGLAIAAKSVGFDYPALVLSLALGATLKENYVSSPVTTARPRAVNGLAAAY